MNPILAQLRAHAYLMPDPANQPFMPQNLAHENPAIAYDRNYIATHALHFQHNPDLFAYDRMPLDNEWREAVPSGAFVRVFVINEWTIVRVLHTRAGQRISEPMLDTWRSDVGIPTA